MIPHKPNTSKTVLFACPECAFTFVVDRAYHGSRAICRGCGESVLVNLNEPEVETAVVEPQPAVEKRKPVAQPAPRFLPPAIQCQKCQGRAIHEWVTQSELWWSDELGRPHSQLTYADSASSSKRCVSCGFVEFRPGDWLPPHDEAGFRHGPNSANTCQACEGFCETGLLTNEQGRPAEIMCGAHANTIEPFRINAGRPDVPISATHCHQCGKVEFMARKWMNEEGAGGANLLGERPR